MHTFTSMPDPTTSAADLLVCLLLWHDELTLKAREGTILPFERGFLEVLPGRILAARLRVRLHAQAS